jgi:hypothetical protein
MVKSNIIPPRWHTVQYLMAQYEAEIIILMVHGVKQDRVDYLIKEYSRLFEERKIYFN